MPEPQSTVVVNSPEVLRSFDRMQEAEFVIDFLEKAIQYRQEFVPIWDEIISNRLVNPFWQRRGTALFTGDGPVGAARNNFHRFNRGTKSVLKDPETAQIIDTLTAMSVNLILNQPEFVQATAVGSDDVEKARYVSRLTERILLSPGVYRTMFEVLQDAWTLGAGILEMGWETRSRMQVQFKRDPDGARETEIRETIYRDAPTFHAVDRYDFYTDPSGTRIQENMLGIIKRFTISKQEAVRLGDADVYNKAAVRKAIQTADGKYGSNPTPEDDENRRWHEGYFGSYITRETAGEYGVMTGFEFWGELPFQLRSGAPTNRVITILNGEHVRSNVNPYIDGMIPFKEFVPNPINGRFDGLSPGEIIRFLQDSADFMLMGTTDAMDMAWRNILLLGNSFQGDWRRLRERRPNDIIRCQDPNAAIPLPFDTGAMQLALQNYGQRKSLMRQAAQAEAPVQGIPSSGSDRQTATEVNTILQQATQGIQMSANLIERNDLPYVGRMLLSRLKQFTDPERQYIIAGERFPVSLDDVDFEADIAFSGSRQGISKFQKAQAMQTAIQILGQSPEVVEVMPELITRLLRDGLDIKDAQQIVENAVRVLQAKRQEAQQQQLQQQAAQTQGQAAVQTQGNEQKAAADQERVVLQESLAQQTGEAGGPAG